MRKLPPVYSLCPNNKHVVLRDGREIVHLNERLVKSQGVSDEDLDQIRILHMNKNKVYDLMEKTDDKEELRELAAHVTNIEYDLQKFWGFTQDKTYHDWFLVPKCKCPKWDNMERKGTEYQIKTVSCPIHGR